MVAIRAGRLREWSQGELRLYTIKGRCRHMWGKFRGLRFAGSLISLITADENLYGMKGTGLAVSLKTINIQLQRYNNQELIKTIVDQYSMGYNKILFQSFFYCSLCRWPSIQRLNVKIKPQTSASDCVRKCRKCYFSRRQITNFARHWHDSAQYNVYFVCTAVYE